MAIYVGPDARLPTLPRPLNLKGKKYAIMRYKTSLFDLANAFISQPHPYTSLLKSD